MKFNFLWIGTILMILMIVLTNGGGGIVNAKRLSNEEKIMIKKIVSEHLIDKLKDVYAISTRSRIG